MSMYSIWNVQDIKTRDECIWHVNEMNLFDTWTLRPTQGGCVLYSKQGLSKSANSTVSLYQRVGYIDFHRIKINTKQKVTWIITCGYIHFMFINPGDCFL